MSKLPSVTCLLIGSKSLLKFDAQHLILFPDLRQCVLQLKHLCAHLPLQSHLIILHTEKMRVRRGVTKTNETAQTHNLPPCARAVVAVPSSWCWVERVSHLTEPWGSETRCRAQKTVTADSDTLRFLSPSFQLGSAAPSEQNRGNEKSQQNGEKNISWWIISITFLRFIRKTLV